MSNDNNNQQELPEQVPSVEQEKVLEVKKYRGREEWADYSLDYTQIPEKYQQKVKDSANLNWRLSMNENLIERKAALARLEFLAELAYVFYFFGKRIYPCFRRESDAVKMIGNCVYTLLRTLHKNHIVGTSPATVRCYITIWRTRNLIKAFIQGALFEAHWKINGISVSFKPITKRREFECLGAWLTRLIKKFSHTQCIVSLFLDT